MTKEHYRADKQLMAHQKHISNLLAASSLLDSAPPSPYTRQLTLPSYQAPTNLSRRQIARQQNSPFTGAARERAVGDTPTKKKKSRVQQLGREDDDSSAGGKKLVKKKKLHVSSSNIYCSPTSTGKAVNSPYDSQLSLTCSNARAPSPTESVASASFAPNPAYPRTARQLAAHQAAQQKAKRAERDEDSDESEPERMPEIKKRSAFPGVAQGMQVTPSTDSVADMMQDPAGGSTIKTPTLAAAQIKKVRTQTTVSGVKRGRDDESEDDKPLATSNGHVQSKNSRKPSAVASGPPGPDGEHTDGEVPEGAEGTDGDKTLYCTCRQVSWGEMIGCDDDECEFEWVCLYIDNITDEQYHITCLGYDRPPEGTWYCPQCAERRKRNPPKSKKPPKGKARR